VVGKSKSDLVFDVFVYVILTVVLLIVVYPLYFVVIASISDPLSVLAGDVILTPKNLNLESYRMVFRDSSVMTGYRNTIFYTVVGTTVNMILSTAAAYALSCRNLKGKGVILGMMVFTMFFNGGLIPTFITINNLGLLDTIWVMILPTAISTYNVMIMRTFFLNSIPYELQEAAIVDGASHFNILFNVILPLSKPILAVMVLYYAVRHWNSYFSAMIYLSDHNKYPLQLVLRRILIQSQASEESLIDAQGTFNRMLQGETMKYALIIVVSAPVLCMYPFLQKYFVQGIMVGSVKG
jgi:putative aldouronate transport system permease protein